MGITEARGAREAGGGVGNRDVTGSPAARDPDPSSTSLKCSFGEEGAAGARDRQGQRATGRPRTYGVRSTFTVLYGTSVGRARFSRGLSFHYIHPSYLKTTQRAVVKPAQRTQNTSEARKTCYGGGPRGMTGLVSTVSR